MSETHERPSPAVARKSKRVISNIIEGIVIVPVSIFVTLFIQVALGQDLDWWSVGIDSLVVGVLITYLNDFLWVTNRGKTLGKAIVGLRVVQMTAMDQNPTRQQAIIRTTVRGAIVFWLLSYTPPPAEGVFVVLQSVTVLGVIISIFVDQLGRGWHDKLGGTIVVDDVRAPRNAKQAP